MLVITGTILLGAQSDIATITQILANRAKRSRRDKGCIDYAFSVSVENPNEIRLIEKWESEELLNLHLQIPDPEFNLALETSAITEAKVIAYEAASDRTLLDR